MTKPRPTLLHELRAEAVSARRLARFYAEQAAILHSPVLADAATAAYESAELREQQAHALTREVPA